MNADLAVATRTPCASTPRGPSPASAGQVTMETASSAAQVRVWECEPPLQPQRALKTFTALPLDHSGFNLLLMRLGLNSFQSYFVIKLYVVLMRLGVIIKVC